MIQQRCDLCGRVTKRGTTEHHLIPRTCHSNKWFKKNFTREQMVATIDVCRDCHSAIHRLEPETRRSLGVALDVVRKRSSEVSKHPLGKIDQF